jgi:hypothetical protein
VCFFAPLRIGRCSLRQAILRLSAGWCLTIRGRRPKHPRWKVALAGRPEHVQSRARDAPHQVHDRVVESSIKMEGEELHADRCQVQRQRPPPLRPILVVSWLPPD